MQSEPHCRYVGTTAWQCRDSRAKGSCCVTWSLWPSLAMQPPHVIGPTHVYTPSFISSVHSAAPRAFKPFGHVILFSMREPSLSRPAKQGWSTMKYKWLSVHRPADTSEFMHPMRACGVWRAVRGARRAAWRAVCVCAVRARSAVRVMANNAW